MLAPKCISQLKALGFCFDGKLASKLRWKREQSASYATVQAGLRGGGLDPKVAKRQRELARISGRNQRGQADGKARLSVSAKTVGIKCIGARGKVTSMPRSPSLLRSPARALLMLGGARKPRAFADGVESEKDESIAALSEAAGAASRAGAVRSAAALGKEVGDGREGMEDALVRALLGAHDKVEKRQSHSLFDSDSRVWEANRKVDPLVLGDKWMSYFRQLKSFRGKFGHDAVSKSQHQNPHFMLGRWVRCVSMHVSVHACERACMSVLLCGFISYVGILIMCDAVDCATCMLG